MIFDRAGMVLLVGLMCGAHAPAQEPSALQARLTKPSARARATVEFRRIVIRDALVTQGPSQGVERPVEALRRLAEGKDRELAVLARWLLL